MFPENLLIIYKIYIY